MRKKSGFIILIIVIVLQLCVPAGMIAYKTAETNAITENGELVKIKISSMTYTEGVVEFDIITYDDWGNFYAEIQETDTIYAKLVLRETKPEGDFYIKSNDKYEFDFPVRKIKTEDFSNLEYIYFIEKTGNESWWDKIIAFHELYDYAYLEAYVYKGKVVPVAVYVNGVEINTYLSRLNEAEKQ